MDGPSDLLVIWCHVRGAHAAHPAAETRQSANDVPRAVSPSRDLRGVVMRAIQDVLNRLRAEFVKMPGLRLKAEQGPILSRRSSPGTLSATLSSSRKTPVLSR
jgi:hypothetical protein